MSYAEFRALKIPDKTWQVEDLLVRGTATLLSAREKSGKGFLSLDLAVCVALGRQFLGHEVVQAPVAYITLEESVQTVRERAAALIGDQEDVPLYIYVADLDEDEFKLEDPNCLNWLQEQIAENGIQLVVLDVLREMHDGRENDSDDMAWRLKGPRVTAHRTGSTILITHHANREGSFRGSTAIAAAFDDTWHFERDDLDSDSGMRGRLTGKGRNLKFMRKIEFDADTHRWQAIDGTPAHSQPVNAREKIVACINDQDGGMSPEEIAESTGLKIGTVRNALGKMEQESYRRFRTKGSGKRGDPKRYFPSLKHQPRLIAHANGKPTGPACVECGVAIKGGLYCSKHGGADGDLLNEMADFGRSTA